MDELYARAMGKAVLANLDQKERSSIIDKMKITKLTAKTLSSKKKILKDIELTRNRGYSINNEEYIDGLICIGAPVVNYRRKTTVGAVSLDFPTSEYSIETIQRDYPGVLTKLASEVSEAVTSVEI
jgi:IclR family pca regulon transcriptional regulator